MKNIFCAFGVVLIFYTNLAIGSEAGMPQLNPEFWVSQIFWLIVTFSILYLIIWKVFLPRITYSIESRKSKIVNDLNETQKLKENAEKKLNEYNDIIKNSKKEAKKIIDDNKKKLDRDLEDKKKKFNDEIEKELIATEKEIKNLKKASIENINKIAEEVSAEIIKQFVDSEVNKSNVSAIVSDKTKKQMEKYL
jgi:F-type H+-transporting ATPase subunit b